MAPIRIQAQALRRRKAASHADTFGAFPILPEALDKADAARRKPWQQADLERAINAAKEAELSSYRVEVAPDGTISVIVGDPAETAEPNPYSDLLWGRGCT